VKDAGGPQVAIRSLSGTTPEQAQAARAQGWRYVFECWHENRKAAEAGGRDDVKDRNGNVATKHHNR
jgi:hypothetical protein